MLNSKTDAILWSSNNGKKSSVIWSMKENSYYVLKKFRIILEKIRVI